MDPKKYKVEFETDKWERPDYEESKSMTPVINLIRIVFGGHISDKDINYILIFLTIILFLISFLVLKVGLSTDIVPLQPPYPT